MCIASFYSRSILAQIETSGSALFYAFTDSQHEGQLTIYTLGKGRKGSKQNVS